jgi:hypothetical protein
MATAIARTSLFRALIAVSELYYSHLLLLKIKPATSGYWQKSKLKKDALRLARKSTWSFSMQQSESKSLESIAASCC